jgi:hypothetical protein
MNVHCYQLFIAGTSFCDSLSGLGASEKAEHSAPIHHPFIMIGRKYVVVQE